MPLCGKLCCSAVNGGCFSKTGKMTIELLEIAKAMYSNGNAITCSDMLKILFFHWRLILYSITGENIVCWDLRTAYIWILKWNSALYDNNVMLHMFRNLHLSVTLLHHIIMAKRNLSKIYEFYIQIYIYHQKHIWNDAESLDLLYYFLFYESHVEASSLRSCFMLISFFISCCLSEDAR